MTKYISTTQTVQILRGALIKAFPGTKFSVRSHKYAGGATIRIEYTNGASYDKVHELTQKFEGSNFDPMTGLKTLITRFYDGESVHFGADYIFVYRRTSKAARETAHKEFKDKFKWTLEFDRDGSILMVLDEFGGLGDWNQLRWLTREFHNLLNKKDFTGIED